MRVKVAAAILAGSLLPPAPAEAAVEVRLATPVAATIAAHGGAPLHRATADATARPSHGLSAQAMAVATAAVPEPATWAMMLVGFAMVGAVTRYRRRAVVTVA